MRRGEIIADRYEVRELIGEGGLAQVWRVRHVELGSVHALKLLIFRRARLAERLVLEGRIQAQLRHPNIVHVNDIVRHEGQVGLLMELVDGISLQEYLEQHGALETDTALDLFASVLSAVAAAHASGVLHRDLKPANILLARDHRGFVPKVTDFGIAKVVEHETDAHATRVGAVMGTPGYLAPEQALDSSAVDQRADVFALGAILYMMLTGQQAFPEATGTDIHSMTTTPIRELQPDLDDELVEVIDAALELDRAKRLSSCRDMAAELFAKRPDLLQKVVGDPCTTPVPLSLSMKKHEPHDKTSATLLPANPTPPPARTAPPIAPPIAPPQPQLQTTNWWIPGLAIVTLLGLGLLSLRIAYTPQATSPQPDSITQTGEERDDRGARPTPTKIARPAPINGSPDDGTSRPPEVVLTDQEDAKTLKQAMSSGAVPPAPAEEAPAAQLSGDAPSDLGATPPATAAAPDPSATETPVSSEEPESPMAAVVPEADGTPTDAQPPSDGDVATTASPEAPSSDTPAPPATDDAAPQTEAPTEAPTTYPAIQGSWVGSGAGKPMRLRLDQGDGGRITAEVTFTLGSIQRSHVMSGTLSPTGQLELRESEGTLVFRGTVQGTEVSGTYQRAGQRKPSNWQARWDSN